MKEALESAKTGVFSGNVGSVFGQNGVKSNKKRGGGCQSGKKTTSTEFKGPVTQAII